MLKTTITHYIIDTCIKNLFKYIVSDPEFYMITILDIDNTIQGIYFCNDIIYRTLNNDEVFMYESYGIDIEDDYAMEIYNVTYFIDMSTYMDDTDIRYDYQGSVTISLDSIRSPKIRKIDKLSHNEMVSIAESTFNSTITGKVHE